MSPRPRIAKPRREPRRLEADPLLHVQLSLDIERSPVPDRARM
jgi:hypothetical protein